MSLTTTCSPGNERDSKNMVQANQSQSVQRALPDLVSLRDTFGFDKFLANPPPTITSDPRAVREHIRGYAVQLERHERFTNIWKHQYQNQLVNLRQLIAVLDTRCKELELLTTGNIQNVELNETLLGLPEFEDLYYFLAYKTRTLYSDLQLRFLSEFITLDDVLHFRGSSSYAQVRCTVRDFRNFLRAVWFHLLHPAIVHAIETSINRRKYQMLKANPLLPSWDVDDLTPGNYDSMVKYKLGLNLDDSTMCSMFEHLDDVSAMSIPALLMKVAQAGIGTRDAYSEQHQSFRISCEEHVETTGNTSIEINNEEDIYDRKQIPDTGRYHGYAIGKKQHYRSNSDDPRAKLGDIKQRPVRRTLLLPLHLATSSEDVHQHEVCPSTTSNVVNWLPNVTARDSWVQTSSIPANASIEGRTLHIPEGSTIDTYLSPNSQSSYRKPFHGREEFPRDPPTPPPKAPSHTTRYRAPKTLGEVEGLQRDSSRLQDALQQVELLRRENSQLQEQLSQASPPRGLFRRISKARNRSPAKSPRRSIVNTAIQ